MAESTTGKILDIGLLAALGIGAYLLWSRFTTTGGEVINKACGELSGLPRILCELGGQVTGGYDFDAALCAWFGGTIDGTGQCKIYPNITPDPVDQPQDCPAGKIWDYILKACVIPAATMKLCPNGMWTYSDMQCPGTEPDNTPTDRYGNSCSGQYLIGATNFIMENLHAATVASDFCYPSVEHYAEDCMDRETLARIKDKCAGGTGGTPQVQTCLCDPVLGITATFDPAVTNCQSACLERWEIGKRCSWACIDMYKCNTASAFPAGEAGDRARSECYTKCGCV